MTNEFTFSVALYDKKTVIKLLQNYLNIRLALIDRMPITGTVTQAKARHEFVEKPLGSSSHSTWPFMSKAPAQSRTDGKKRGRMMEELHCASLDLEQGLSRLKPDEFQLIADYYIFGNGTIEELAESRGLLSKGRLHDRLMRIVRKLVRYMNEGTYVQSES